METNRIYNIDALELLKQIDDKSSNLILTDLPYNLDFSKYDTLSDKGGRKFHYTEKLKWDKGFDLKGMSEKLFPEFDRILKEDGSVLIFGPQELGYYYYEPALKNNLHWKCQLIWEKDNPCLLPNSKIYTETFLKDIKDIIIGEKVWGIKRWDEVIKKYPINYSGNIYKISLNGGFNISVTPEHQFFAVRQKPCSLPCFSKRICNYYYKFTNSSCNRSKSPNKRKCKRYCDFYKPEFIEAKKLKPRDLVMFPRTYTKSNINSIDVFYFERGHHIKKAKLTVPLNADIMRLLGYYLAEGHFGNHKRARNKIPDNSGGFTLHKKETDMRDDIINIIEKYFNYKCKWWYDENRIRVRFCCAPLINFLLGMCGHKAYKKSMNPIILNQNHNLLMELVYTFFKGDGCFYQGKKGPLILFSTTSKYLFNQLLIILKRNGYVCGSQIRTPEQMNKNKTGPLFLNKRDMYTVMIRGEQINNFLNHKPIYKKYNNKKYSFSDENYVYLPIREIKLEDYSGIVYDITTKDHQYVSACGITHNCPQLRKKNYRSAHECIVWFARWDEKKCLYTFNWKGQRKMKNVIKMPILQGEERLDHPTQKPLKLIKFLLEVHSNPNDLVVDPFSGVATTALACLMTGRRFIGSEIDKNYFELGNKRLEGWMQQKKLEVEEDGFGNTKLTGDKNEKINTKRN